MLGVSYEFSKYNHYAYSIEYHMRFINHAESNGINMDCFVNLFCFNTICNPYWRASIIVHSETDFSAELNILYTFDIRFLRKTMMYKKIPMRRCSNIHGDIMDEMNYLESLPLCPFMLLTFSKHWQINHISMNINLFNESSDISKTVGLNITL